MRFENQAQPLPVARTAEPKDALVFFGDTVDGTNGSRVMSVEKSCTDVTITGNTFRSGGGREVVVDPTCTDVLIHDNVGVRQAMPPHVEPVAAPDEPAAAR